MRRIDSFFPGNPDSPFQENQFALVVYPASPFRNFAIPISNFLNPVKVIGIRENA